MELESYLETTKKRERSMSSTWEKTDCSDGSEEDANIDTSRLDRYEHSKRYTRTKVNDVPLMMMAVVNNKSNKSNINSKKPMEIYVPSDKSGCWMRGQTAAVRWQVLDPSVEYVRIDLCNLSWDVPTIIAHNIKNDGTFDWKRVYWGMPIQDGYFLKFFDIAATQQELARSACFSIVR
jgi:hypothetical protein